MEGVECADEDTAVDLTKKGFGVAKETCECNLGAVLRNDMLKTRPNCCQRKAYLMYAG